ncbi:hypothetical protein [Planktothricoides raciborskii]|uniref:Spore coat protein U domain-containing protein n=2 Tax=Planktothricoides raciborskii TaxID=132608 RepID=A0AAU8JN90_9CYAN|nr:hypothetical protein [Planktothricoides raciborskii]MBD2547020.1 hypothetical protein [Planktothricoides raciborskii FACHB-1370]MBD2581336.1 hypothetical protein [Planktothricoides raciborskii FACHB-1261]
MSLRRSLIASSLILAPITTLGFGSAAFAGSANDSVTLSATVQPIIAIDATATSVASSLPMTAGSQTAHVADLNITSNNTAGLTIQASSTNSGVLVSRTNPTDNINYTVAVVNDGATPTSGTTLSSLSQSKTSGFNTTTGVKPMDLYIQYNLPNLPKQGGYSDTLTITIADN